jgi:hypothetical protein
VPTHHGQELGKTQSGELFKFAYRKSMCLQHSRKAVRQLELIQCTVDPSIPLLFAQDVRLSKAERTRISAPNPSIWAQTAAASAGVQSMPRTDQETDKLSNKLETSRPGSATRKLVPLGAKTNHIKNKTGTTRGKHKEPPSQDAHSHLPPSRPPAPPRGLVSAGAAPGGAPSPLPPPARAPP